jgi:carbon storage regulator
MPYTHLQEIETEFVMLVLSRGKGERILIGDDIEVVVNHVKGDRVSLGITAPKETRILRTEVAERDRKNQTHRGL